MSIEPTPAKPKDGPRQRGACEYFLHRGEYRNPFPHGSADFNQYERGWTQSLKRNGGKLVSLDAPPRTSGTPTPAPLSNYNAYAELKGRSTPRK